MTLKSFIHNLAVKCYSSSYSKSGFAQAVRHNLNQMDSKDNNAHLQDINDKITFHGKIYKFESNPDDTKVRVIRESDGSVIWEGESDADLASEVAIKILNEKDLSTHSRVPHEDLEKFRKRYLEICNKYNLAQIPHVEKLSADKLGLECVRLARGNVNPWSDDLHTLASDIKNSIKIHHGTYSQVNNDSIVELKNKLIEAYAPIYKGADEEFESLKSHIISTDIDVITKELDEELRDWGDHSDPDIKNAMDVVREVKGKLNSYSWNDLSEDEKSKRLDEAKRFLGTNEVKDLNFSDLMAWICRNRYNAHLDKKWKERDRFNEAQNILTKGFSDSTPSDSVKTYSSVSSKLPGGIDSTLQDVAQMFDNRLSYSHIMELGNKWDSLDKEIKSKIRSYVNDINDYASDGDDDEATESSEKLVDYLIEKNLIS